MIMFNQILRQLFLLFAAAILTIPLSAMGADALPAMVDNFEHDKLNSLGIERQFLNDNVAGGASKSTVTIQDKHLYLSGELIPPRGQPAWASAILLLDASGAAQDASHFQGIRLRVKLNHGMMSVSANSAEITNFDFHAAQVVVAADGQFHEVKIPFTTMKRAWSPQTTLNASTLTSLSIVAFALQKSTYDFVIDEVSFY